MLSSRHRNRAFTLRSKCWKFSGSRCEEVVLLWNQGIPLTLFVDILGIRASRWQGVRQIQLLPNVITILRVDEVVQRLVEHIALKQLFAMISCISLLIHTKLPQVCSFR